MLRGSEVREASSRITIRTCTSTMARLLSTFKTITITIHRIKFLETLKIMTWLSRAIPRDLLIRDTIPRRPPTVKSTTARPASSRLPPSTRKTTAACRLTRRLQSQAHPRVSLQWCRSKHWPINIRATHHRRQRIEAHSTQKAKEKRKRRSQQTRQASKTNQ